ncbi:hypothetical protein WI36_15380 [Burkholderia ubonensis]|uniref:Uncharacterized protein n=1 Tax=Burkholderia ubonensis TaxID=101571 RepID=A0A102K4X0_9BURK|nr:hypothetical protein [Burkholderia ubonensis]KUZ68756.1 hypothetical protein WI35_17775 [Burkholderia ubonensis]KUZ73586.1 hypothetical protein WI36_15380 [Burkholderia ubonensis]KUZ84373.1 hypothetical protein WI38_26070 [Burkholderia ubonensis]KUZ97915.1 hypothetical protein WI39_08150 [Burkholderia ubonensis]
MCATDGGDVNVINDQPNDHGDMALPLLMGEWAVLMEIIRLRLDQIERIDPDSLDEDALADLYEDQDTLTRLLAYIENGFARTFGGLPAAPASGFAPGSVCPGNSSAPLPHDEPRATGSSMSRIADRVALLICGVVFAGIAWATFRYAGAWVMPVVTAVMLVALGSEVRRLRRLLDGHGIDWRPRRRFFRK